jgi:catechol 2,3-dioxygenase-like lactoylglutathione lyase family enzyme
VQSLPVKNFAWAPVVPELLVADLGKSLRFWRDLCGFAVAFERFDEGFAYLDRDGAQIMLEERGHGRNWVTGPLDTPLGRGVNFQIVVSAIEPIVTALALADWPLFMAPERKWYRTGGVETGVYQFLVQDLDGYLIRFSAHLGERSVAEANSPTEGEF